MLSYHNHPATIGSLFKRLWTLFLWKRKIKCNTLLLLLLLLDMGVPVNTFNLVAGNEVNVCATASCEVINEFRSHTKLHLLDVNYGKNVLFCKTRRAHGFLLCSRRQSAWLVDSVTRAEQEKADQFGRSSGRIDDVVSDRRNTRRTKKKNSFAAHQISLRCHFFVSARPDTPQGDGFRRKWPEVGRNPSELISCRNSDNLGH